MVERVHICTALLILQPFGHFTYVTTHSPTLPSLYLRYSSFSNLSVTSPTSQLILQHFRRFTYVTSHSITLPSLHLRHSSFSNPSFASPTSQALHLIHLASRPCYHEINNVYLSSSECSAQRHVLHWKRRNLGCSSAEGRSSTTNSGTKDFTRDLTGAVASRCFPHSTLSLASEQTLKDPRSTNEEVRRVDLANWALRTSPKFTTGIKYEFHQGFLPDQRSGNPNHPSPPS